jgi:hypothetical protein
MTTDYKNLTAFEMAAVFMIVIGISLIGFQVFISLPDQTKTEITTAVQILSMPDVLDTQLEVNEFVFGGIKEFYNEFYIASYQLVLDPVMDGIDRVSLNYQKFAAAFKEVSDSLASNYQNNYVQSGVEAGVEGNVLGAYLEKLSQ